MSAYEPLHHKYRPQIFADLVGQEAIAQTLTNALNQKRIAPAYLFTGPRGTGKTSSARILAKSLNCLHSDKPTPTPCGECEVCLAIAKGSALDVIEIDAASNTGVDNIREIIERSQFAPVQCRYKVYVIDECHMLSTAAFNALLKTLEEPPDRVIFVLATTDPQRVLPTIISRCQRFDYRRIPLPAMVAHLATIAQKEAIAITPEALTLVAQLSNGGLRDAESLLDQLSLLSETIVPEKVWNLVGSVPENDLLSLLQAIASNDPETILDCSRQILDRGREPLILLQNLAGFYLNLLIAKTAPNRADMVATTAQTWKKLSSMAPHWSLATILQGQQRLKDSEYQIRNATQPRLWLEVTLLSLLPANQPIPENTTENKILSPAQTRLSPSAATTAPSISSQPSAQPSPQSALQVVQGSNGNGNGNGNVVSDRASMDSPVAEPEPDTDLEAIWQGILGKLPSLVQALLRSHCHLLMLRGNSAKIGVKSEALMVHAQKKVPEIEAAFFQWFQRPIRVQFQLDVGTEAKSVSLATANPSTPPAATPNLTRNALPPRAEISPISSGGSPREVKSDDNRYPSPDPVIPPRNGAQHLAPAIATPSTPSTPSTQTAPSQEDLAIPEQTYSDNELHKAAETFAKLFDGEIVHLAEESDPKNSKIESKAAPESAHKPPLIQQVEVNASLNVIAANGSPRILGRPDPSQFDEEDDLPF
jgi:DNA polymerase-3 subunit gamma/tau